MDTTLHERWDFALLGMVDKDSNHYIGSRYRQCQSEPTMLSAGLSSMLSNPSLVSFPDKSVQTLDPDDWEDILLRPEIFPNLERNHWKNTSDVYDWVTKHWWTTMRTVFPTDTSAITE